MLFGVAMSVKRWCRALAPGQVMPVTFDAGARRLAVRQPSSDRGIRHDIGTVWLSCFADGSFE